jgi:hypothetical protein
VTSAALLLILVGCSSTSSGEAQSAAARFYDAYRGHDGAAACALLAPATRAEVESASGKSCADGLLEEKLSGTNPRHASVYGDQAQVLMSGDTVFLAKFPLGWRVVAVGCTPVREKPYDCDVEAG